MKKLLIVAAFLTAVSAQATAKAHSPTAEDFAAPVKNVPYKAGHYPVINVKKFGIEFKRSRDGFAYINGSLAAKDEDNADATVYSAGLVSIAVYKKTGKINAMEDGKFLGRMK